MSLIKFLVVSVAVFGILNWWLIPTLRKRLLHNLTIDSMPRAATLGMLESLRSACLVIMLTTAMIVLFVWVSSMVDLTSVDSVSSAVATAQSWRGRLANLSAFWSIAAVFLLVFGLALHARRRTKLRYSKVFEKKQQQELDRLMEEFERGEWEELPPTSLMEQIDDELMKLHTTANELVNEVDADDPRLKEAMLHLQLRADDLQQMRLQADLHRRIDRRLDPTAFELPPPTNWLQRIERFFFSEGLVNSLQFGSKLAYLAVLVLLVPSMIGVCAGPIQRQLDDRIARLSDLQLTLDEQQAGENWSAAVAALPTDDGKEETEEEDLSDDELSEIDAIAAEAEAEFLESLSDEDDEDVDVPFADDMRVLRATATRQRLLASAARYRPKSVQVSANLRNADFLDPKNRRLVGAIEDAQFGKPRTKFGKSLSAKIKKAAAQSPSFRRRIRNAVSSFQRAAPIDRMGRAVGSQVLGAVFEQPLDGMAASAEFSKDASRLQEKAGKVSSARSADFAADLTRGQSVEEALANMREKPFRSNQFFDDLQSYRQNVTRGPPDFNRILEQVHRHPPSLDNLPEPHARILRAGEQVDNAATRLLGRNLSGRSVPFADCLAQYSDHFAPYRFAERGTIRGQVLEAWDQGKTLNGQLDSLKTKGARLPDTIVGTSSDARVPGTSSSANAGPNRVSSKQRPVKLKPQPAQIRNTSFVSRTSSSSKMRTSFGRSRSFRGLRGFARVGGVLIGNDPDSASSDATLDWVGLDWKIDGDLVTLVAEDSGGNHHESAPFRASVLIQALAYAADGRPLAVTMVTAEPLTELKILTHPALVDTPLGVRVVAVDRLVDQFTGDSELRKTASLDVVSTIALYRYARAYRLDKASSSIQAIMATMSSEHSETKQVLESIFAHAEQELADEELQQLSLLALKRPSVISDKDRSPLRAKPEFFDQELVSEIAAAASQATDLASFEEKLWEPHEKLFSSKDTRENPSTPFELKLQMLATLDPSQRQQQQFDTVVKWLPQAPEYQIWSGVREKTFDLNGESVLSRDRKEGALEFILQVAFTSAPSFLPEKEQAEIEENGVYLDESPWEFPGIADELHQAVLRSIEERAKEGNELEQTVLKDATEFAYAQRFFRSALAGKLGEDFPLERLIALQDDCLKTAPPTYWRTLRWNSREGALESRMLALLEQVEVSSSEIEEGIALLSKREELVQARDLKVKAILLLLPNNSIPQEDWLRTWDKTWHSANEDLQKWESSWKEFVDRWGTSKPDRGAHRELLRVLQHLTDAMEIRRSLGVWVDDRQAVLDSIRSLPEL